ncbi:MAG: site-specific integrase [Clostridia bacterium]|nr:site-specific integrase [Clostridia bacterium]
MSVRWISAGEKGVRYYEHETRRHGVGRDRYFAIRYTVDGKAKEEGLGWGSEGWTIERAIAERSKLVEARRTGHGPTTLEEKRRQAAQAKAEAERQQQLEAAKLVTLSQYWPVYLTSAKLIAGDRKKPRSWEGDESAFVNWLEPILGETPIRDIGLDQWDRFMGALVDGGLAPRTRQYMAGVLRQILAHAFSRGLVPYPPPQARDVGATLGRGGNRRTRTLSNAELQAILEALIERDRHAYAITLFCAMTGCRLGEASGLQWKDVDLASGEATFYATKNGKDRTIPLSAALVDFLTALRRQGRLAGHVFLNGLGHPYTGTPQAFRNVVSELGLNEGRAKRDKVVFHTLRHTAATRLAKAGTSLPDLQEVCGWSSPIMALRYAHGDDKTKRRAMNALGDDLMSSCKVISLKN